MLTGNMLTGHMLKGQLLTGQMLTPLSKNRTISLEKCWRCDNQNNKLMWQAASEEIPI